MAWPNDPKAIFWGATNFEIPEYIFRFREACKIFQRQIIEYGREQKILTQFENLNLRQTSLVAYTLQAIEQQQMRVVTEYMRSLDYHKAVDLFDGAIFQTAPSSKGKQIDLDYLNQQIEEKTGYPAVVRQKVTKTLTSEEK